MTTPPDLTAAAADNARWCDRVSRLAGLPTHRDDAHWWSERRTPPAYPDAVTLRPGSSSAAVLAGLDAGPGASVKDSFADLDLRGAGFDVLFEAGWLASPVAGDGHEPTRLAWSDAAPDELRALAPELGRDPRPSLALVGRDGTGRTAASVVLACGTPDDGWPEAAATVGAVHVTTCAGDPHTVWLDLPALVRDRVPGARRVVGYEHGTAADAATAAGFTVVGALRVWVRPD